MAQGCGEHMGGKVCVEHCDQCREKGHKTHIFVPVPDFFREHPDTALGYEIRCPVCRRKAEVQRSLKVQEVQADSLSTSETLPPSFVGR